MSVTNDGDSAAPDAAIQPVERVLVKIRTVFIVGAAVAILLAIVSFAQQHGYFRPRTPAGLTMARSNISELRKMAHVYADDHTGGKVLPADFRELYGTYISDWKVFQNPRFKTQNLGFIYVPGTNPEAENEIMLYEDVPPGFNNLRALGFSNLSARNATQAEFHEALLSTIAALQARGVPFTPQRLPVTEAEWRAYAAERATHKPNAAQLGTNAP